jgi:hypothetical protein
MARRVFAIAFGAALTALGTLPSPAWPTMRKSRAGAIS